MGEYPLTSGFLPPGEHIEYWFIESRKIARYYARYFRLPSRITDDAIGDAMVALCKAINSWNGSEGFRTYLSIRIKGEIVDGLRSLYGRNGQKDRTVCREILPEEHTYDPRGEIFDSINIYQQRQYLIRLSMGLSEIQKDVVVGILNHRTLKDIGKEHGFSESNACLIRKRAVSKLLELSSDDRLQGRI